MSDMSELTIEPPRVKERPKGRPSAGRTAAQPNAAPQYRFDRLVKLGAGRDHPVFAVPHSNGAFFTLGQLIGATYRFVALQAADRISGGRLPGTIEEIATGYVRQLLAEEPRGPYVLLGWCDAGLVAYEAAQQLQAAGRNVAAIVLVATWNPAFNANLSPRRQAINRRIYSLQVVLQDLLMVCRGELSLYDCVRQRNVVCRLLGPVQATPYAAGIVAEAFQAERAFDYGLSEQLRVASLSYRPKPFDGKMLHIRAAGEPSGFGLDRKFGWGGLTNAEHIRVPGDHYTIFVEPAVSQLCEVVMEWLGLTS